MVDDDDSVSREDTDAWIAETWGLSFGAAEAQRKAAVASGNVRADVYNQVLKCWVPADLHLGVLALGNTAVRLSRRDLEWQIRKQLGAPHGPKAGSRRGRREAPYWAAVREIIREALIDDGCPARGDGRQAELERITLNQVATWTDNHPSETTVRNHVAKWIKEYQIELEGR